MISVDLVKGVAIRDGAKIEIAAYSARILSWITTTEGYLEPTDIARRLGIRTSTVHRHILVINQVLGMPRAVRHRRGYGYYVPENA